MSGNGERTGNRVVLAVALPRLDLSFFREITDTDTDCPGMPVSPRHSGFGECVYGFPGKPSGRDPEDPGGHDDAVVRINSQSGNGRFRTRFLKPPPEWILRDDGSESRNDVRRRAALEKNRNRTLAGKGNGLMHALPKHLSPLPVIEQCTGAALSPKTRSRALPVVRTRTKDGTCLTGTGTRKDFAKAILQAIFPAVGKAFSLEGLA
ncbi:hypothetical protein [Leptospirillum ferriphilum]|uniref:hypothetical protein n=1 Tax=Leptospirillum ferriphilum TaxID=178606 RepID=UPI0015C2C778|nr:hypothetical protein [Leptospirillum ferriphilum]